MSLFYFKKKPALGGPLLTALLQMSSTSIGLLDLEQHGVN